MPPSPDKRQYVEYWIEAFQNGYAVCYRNNDTEKDVIAESRSRTVWGARRWARKNKLGKVEYKPGGPDA